MIKLAKLPVPAVLSRNAAKWTKDLLAAKAIDAKAEVKSKWSHADIKDALKHETMGKCAYCESKPLHVSFGDVEHICPKSSKPELAYEWSNLTLACEVCNGRKGAAEGLIDPYVDEPAKHFEFYGPMLTDREHTGSAKRTRITLDLNGEELLSRRCDHLARVKSDIDLNEANPNALERQLARDEIITFYTQEGAEFAACSRKFISDYV
jgi:uncharacterized protein (TIGR02646 family)